MKAKVIIELSGGCVSNVEFQHLLLLIEPVVVIVDYDSMPDDTERPKPTAEQRLDRYVWHDADALVPKGVRIPGFTDAMLDRARMDAPPEFRGHT